MSENSMRWPGADGGPGVDFGSTSADHPESVDTPPRVDETAPPTTGDHHAPADADTTPGAEGARRAGDVPVVAHGEGVDEEAQRSTSVIGAVDGGPESDDESVTPARAAEDPREQATSTAFTKSTNSGASRPGFIERGKQVAAGLGGAAAGAWGSRKDKEEAGGGFTTVEENKTSSEVAATSTNPVKSAVGRTRRTRKARLRLARIDPWSVMKTSFLFSIAFGIMTLVVVFVLWSVLLSSGALESLDSFMATLIGDGENNPFHLTEVVTTGRVLGFAAIIAVIDVVLVTAIATLFSFLYNLAATVIGGLEVTLAED